MGEAGETVHVLAGLSERARDMVQQVKGTQQPILLVVEGKVEAVLLDMAEYDRLKDLAALASEEQGLLQGQEDIQMGHVRPAHEVLEELRQMLAIPR